MDMGASQVPAWSRGHHTFSITGKIVNILDFVDQEANGVYYVRTYIRKEVMHVYKFFMKEIQNIIIEYNFFCNTNLLMRQVEFFRRNNIARHSKLVFKVIQS